jgi:hypothetical protein
LYSTMSVTFFLIRSLPHWPTVPLPNLCVVRVSAVAAFAAGILTASRRVRREKGETEPALLTALR